jgi:uncharacterized protein YqgC (DUF456 family)
MNEALQIVIWLLTLTLMLVGLIGVVVPVLPGTTLILFAAMLHKWLRPEDLSWMAIGFVAIFWGCSVIVDFAGVLIGTKWFGGGKWGMAGASGGALVGMLFSLRLLVLGTILGAIAAERLVAKRTNTEALKAGVGAAFGFVISTIARLACACVMIALFIVAVALPRSAP